MCNHHEKNEMVLAWAVGLLAAQVLPPLTPDGDIAPVPYEAWPKWEGHVIAATSDGRALRTMRWGVRTVVEEKVRYVTNARNNTLLRGHSLWKEAVAHRRCLVPVSAYYEPGLGPPGARGELRFTLRDRPAFFLAGLWEADPVEGKDSYTVVTTEPNDYARRFQDRMPVVLSDTAAFEWLGSDPLPRDQLIALCRPCPAEIMQHTEIAAAPKVKAKKITKADLASDQPQLSF